MNIGGGSQVAGGLGSLAAGGNAIRIAIDLKQSMGEAGAQLMEEYMNATGGPGGYVQTTANENGFVWDPNATSDTPGFIEPGKWVYIDESGESLYYTNEADIKLATYDLPEGCEIPYRRTAFDKLKGWASNISVADVGHFVLDIAGSLPIVGMAADLINTGWYALEGDYKTAALSAAAIFGGSAVLLASKYGSGVTKTVAKFSDEVLPLAEDVAKNADEVIEGVAKGGIELSKKKFGHTFTTHGDDMTDFLTRRAKGSGHMQGQFLDNQKAAQFILDNVKKTANGTVDIAIPIDFPARVIMPDGTFRAATHIRLVPGGKAVGTAFPVIH